MSGQFGVGLRYLSTRGEDSGLSFDDVLLAGLARDGGLYVPDSWPHFEHDALRELQGLPYPRLAARVMAPFVGDGVCRDALEAVTEDAYGGFGHAATAPLKQIGPNDWLLELFHGPTLAFKDFALQLVSRLFDRVLTARGRRVTIVGATSGDTGAAAIEAFRDSATADVFMLHPLDRVSEVQRRQMTTVLAPNLANIAIRGTFDDCQDLVKALFADASFRDRVGLSAVNSINWARVMAQIVYYVHAGVALGGPGRRVAFCVPTGNFGNVFAGYGARAMGLPVERLVVASNANDILTRFFQRNDMSIAKVRPTLSPSMDIQVSSNFERLLFDLSGRDGASVASLIKTFRSDSHLPLDEAAWRKATALFEGHAVDDDSTAAIIADTHAATEEIVDPHTAVGIGAARAARATGALASDVPLVVLATAHPAKFPDAVERAIGRRAALPPRLADLRDREERLDVLDNDLPALKRFILDRLDAGGASRGAA